MTTTPITMEHYRDFIGTLAHEMADLNTDIKAWQHAWERGEMDECDQFEYECLTKNFDALKKCQDFFYDHTDRWVEFDSLLALRGYEQKVIAAYEPLDAYSQTVLPVDGQPLVGITDEEWDRLEYARWDLYEARFAWGLFADFCEYGLID